MDRLYSGHSSCPGCAVALAVRTLLSALPDNAVLVVPPSCIAMMMGPLPLSATSLAVYQTAFETTAAAAAGLSRAYRALGDDAHVVCLAGDGGTYDIGLQALSGAAERNEDFLYVCFDNEAYQNTGNQKSAATPWGAATTSTPRGKATPKKDIMAIVAAHGVPYAATASVAHLDDFREKIARALAVRGTRFLLVTCPCVPGWSIPDDASLHVLRAAVDARVVPLYEVEHGERYRITRWPRGVPVAEYLRLQGRYAHLDAAAIAGIQEDTDRRWEALVERTRRPVPSAVPSAPTTAAHAR